MRKLSIVTLLGIAVLVLFKLGCSDISSSGSGSKIDGIKSVIPARGGYGARVVIAGRGFDPLQKITFNGMEAIAESTSDSVIVTRVPMNATTGPIEIIAKGETLTGPVFTVDSTLTLFVSITGVNPQKAHQLDTVKISGTGFSGANNKQKTKPNYQDDYILTQGTDRDAEDLAKTNPREALSHNPGSLNMARVEHKQATQPTTSHFANEDVAVYFNEIEATILSKSDTLLVATVPMGAQTGLISVVAAADTVVGPNFQVLDHSISKISPSTGKSGTTVTITGVDFSPIPQKNIVTFNGKSATVQSASETELVVIAPNDVSTGEVSVTINTIQKTGSVFTVVEEVKTPEIYSITPDTGSVGMEVTITGKNFSANAAENVVWFKGSSTDVQGELKNSSATELLVEVPYGAETGAISVVANGQTVQGPIFTVVEEVKTPEIQSISPDSGSVGTEVVITGLYFSTVKAENTVKFNGVLATVQSASTTEIRTHVPENASTGPVTVTTNGLTAEGSSFKVVQATKTLNVQVSTVNAPNGFDGYNLKVSGQTDRWLNPNGTQGYSGNLGNEATVQLTQVPTNCTVADNNPRMVQLTGSVTNTYFVVTCVTPAPEIYSITPDTGSVGMEVTITGKHFGTEPSDNDVWFSGSSTDVQGSVISASSTEIIVEVPYGAETGTVSVVVGGQSAQGPIFTVVEESKKLTVNIITNNASPGHDGYNLSVSGEDDRWVHPNSPEVYENITVSQVTIELSQGPMSCLVGGSNPRTVTLGSGTTEVDFVFNCSPEISGLEPASAQIGDTVTVSGNNFNYEAAKNKFFFSGGSTPVEAVLVESSRWDLKVLVPAGAVTGAVSVTSDGVSATGPVFTVLEASKVLKVHVETINGFSGHDGYNLSVSEHADDWIAPDGDYNYSGFTGNQVTVELSQGPPQCMVDIAEGNPQQVTLTGSVTDVYFTITCVLEPEVYSITPDTGYVGMEVTISGKNFGTGQYDNDVWFSGSSTDVQGMVSSASSTEIIVEVPYGAETGIFSVVTNNLTAEGPIFTVVEEPKTINVHSETINGNPGFDGYNLKVGNEDDQWLLPNGIVTYTGDFGAMELFVEIEGVPNNCSVSESNPQLIMLSNTVTDVYFTVTCETPAPEIYSINPSSGHVGMEITIIGDNFSEVPSENNVWFNDGVTGSSGVKGTVTGSSSTEIVVEVPQEAVTGSINIEVGGKWGEGGGTFTVVPESNTLKVHVGTIGGSMGHDGYNLSVTGQTDQWIAPTGEYDYPELTAGQVTVELSQGPPHCMVGIAEGNPQQVTLSGGITDVYFTITCTPPPEVYSFDPDTGYEGDEITIIGENFSEVISENTVYFSSYSGGLEATILYATTTKLAVQIPEYAEPGTVSVDVNGQLAEGLSFDVKYPGTLEINVSTTGSGVYPSGYTLSITDQAPINDVKTTDYFRIENIKRVEVDVLLQGIPQNCTVTGQNPITVNLDNSDRWGYADFNISCTE